MSWKYSNELEVPFKSDKVSQAGIKNQQRRPLNINGSPSQRESSTRNKKQVSIMGEPQ